MKKIFAIKKVFKYLKFHPWKQEEDELLLKYSKIFLKNATKKIDWKEVAMFIPNKNNLQCYRRFLAINPLYKKGKWTEEEDKLLLNLVDQFGKSWKFFAKIFKNRSSKQIRLRFNDHLSPHIIKKEFNKEEDEQLKELYVTHKNKWSKYNKFLPNRTQKDIKKRIIKLLTVKN